MGTPGKPLPSDDVLREALNRAWGQDDASLSKLGKKVGLSPAGVLKFLNGAVPRHKTRNKLLLWYLEQRPEAGEPALSVAEPLFARLLPGLADATRRTLLRRVAALARDAYERQGTPPPLWLGELGDD